MLAIGYDLVEWAPRFWNGTREKTIIHLESTAAEIESHSLPAIEVVGEIGESLRALAAGGDFQAPLWLDGSAHRAALQTLQQHRRDRSFPCQPQRVLADLRTALHDDDSLIADVGVHKRWVATLFPAARATSVLIANGLASMGIAVPGALAATLVHPARKVVAGNGRWRFSDARAGVGDGAAPGHSVCDRSLDGQPLRRHRPASGAALWPHLWCHLHQSGSREVRRFPSSPRPGEWPCPRANDQNLR